ncbi:MAG TPA: AbrB/MazE/SpoVT family DNA-binding domain-containing protein [bacterium]|nr:AbrB/MazE/SpoVT family DNA-binding domain-containing protein [bacterium]HMW36974.1 AbrB/MazE/SpoVT family DNA-binding domain-containing protein [bacterium]HNB11116.1 AbrB/MazE/SpoVT family DNA-binding domain-containing protein [bacterium]HNB57709.1 AbrB/MazE/SpoVT family DNA-binding domain-containing protein [bacterium]HNE85292.1 AbrB/MazE/SpoVT family DNA-binding domain-containing protein [bacterium]
MQKTAVRKIGNSLGITLPKTVLENFHLSEGDELHLIETNEGIILSPFNPDFSEWATAYDQVNRKYRNTLHKFAK